MKWRVALRRIEFIHCAALPLVILSNLPLRFHAGAFLVSIVPKRSQISGAWV